MKRPVVSIGDALRAVAALEPRDADALQALIRMLGLDAEAGTRAAPSIGAWKSTSTKTPSSQPIQMPAREPERAALASQQPRLPARLRRLRTGGGTAARPSWLDRPGDVLGPANAVGEPPRKRALFDRLSRRGILSATLATLVAEGEPDIDEVVRIVGDGRPLQRVPRLPTATVRAGAQLLLDIGSGMDLFLEDQQQIVDALDDILADDRLEVFYFAGCPGRGVGTGPRADWLPWTPPPRGVPVVVLTDLGIGGPVLDDDRAGPAEWLRFARHVRSEGHPLIALVPYEASRWPPALARDLVVVHWSERTTVGAVRRTIRHAWRRVR